MKFFANYFFFTIFIHYKLKLCRKISALMNIDHICQAVSKPTPQPTKLKNFSSHSSDNLKKLLKNFAMTINIHRVLFDRSRN